MTGLSLAFRHAIWGEADAEFGDGVDEAGR
jgi:hypothetical protein